MPICVEIMKINVEMKVNILKKKKNVELKIFTHQIISRVPNILLILITLLSVITNIYINNR